MTHEMTFKVAEKTTSFIYNERVITTFYYVGRAVIRVMQYAVLAGNFSGTKKTEEIMVARGSMLELLRIDEDKLVSKLRG